MPHPTPFSMTIAGRPCFADRTVPVINPATGDVFALAPACSAAQLEQAVAGARSAFDSWRLTSHSERRALLLQLAALLSAHETELRDLLVQEQGKPLADAANEIAAAAYWCQATAAFDLDAEITENSADQSSETNYIPIGVLAAIVPWNFPIGLAFFKIAPALLAGNTIVLKPSPFTPLSMLRIGELLRDLLPPGVLNVISGDDELGPQLSGHPGIDKISFTGATATGRSIMRAAADRLMRVTLELGGNDPAIVLPDVDVERIAPKLFWAAFRNSGQLCIATKRLYVHDAVYDEFAAALVRYSRTVVLGDGADPATALGPLQNKRQYERVVALIAEAKAQNLRFLVGGDVPDGPGYYIPPAIIDNPPDHSRVVQEEAFGPVLPLLRYHDIQDAIARANDSPFGLAASVWSNDVVQAAKIGRQLECGTIWVNTFHHLTPGAAFAGYKQSGSGVENGIDGLREFVKPQTIVIRRPMRHKSMFPSRVLA